MPPNNVENRFLCPGIGVVAPLKVSSGAPCAVDPRTVPANLPSFVHAPNLHPDKSETDTPAAGAVTLAAPCGGSPPRRDRYKALDRIYNTTDRSGSAAKLRDERLLSRVRRSSSIFGRRDALV
ncbi:hypothetical protein EVAR_8262_1 [Eumeta japonica]|uniref:Uncharacterized protein n=1 Tax=Eumeta variegata TaxID=151549 RepID=A0A4C1TFS8_EUMVA|nr:hypothetical protein EVAR_8262_1 [Eumeta japonica]